MPIDRNSAQYITGAIYKPTQTSAPGVWDLDDQANNLSKNLWPLPPQAVQRSLRFNSADSAYLSRIPLASNRRVWTFSCWLKRAKLSAPGTVHNILSTDYVSTNGHESRFDDNNSIKLADLASSNITWVLQTNALYRDCSAWYHIVIAFDSPQGTPSERVKLYVNSTQVTSFATATYPSLNYESYINSTLTHYIGGWALSGSPSRFYDGYMAEVNFVDGQALTPTSFGETDPQTGVWIPKRYTGTYGTNGFRLSFANNSSTIALGYDSSGAVNNWTPNNFSITPGVGNDVFVDVPSLYGTDTGLGGEVLGNYCTINTLMQNTSVATISDGALRAATGTSGVSSAYIGTIGFNSGKWYWEVHVEAVGTNNMWIGVTKNQANRTVDAYLNTWTYNKLGQKTDNSATGSTYGATYTSGDIIGVAVDADAGSITFYKNGVSQGIAFTGLSMSGGVYTIAGSDNSATMVFNFGQRPFAYAAPTGYKALCTTNLPAPAIGQTSNNRTGNYFNVVTYTGDGATSKSITGVGFQPDLVWIKSRTNASGYHILVDSVRGAGLWMATNATTGDSTAGQLVSSLDTNGFSLNLSPNNTVNELNANYVAWCWNAGGTSTTNSAGSNGATIASTYRANRAAGFSIVTYTGTGTAATVAHGLGVKPLLIIGKGRNVTGAYNWMVYHQGQTATKHAYLNLTNVFEDPAGGVVSLWNDTEPTANVFSISSNINLNASGGTYVAYCWAPIPGFSDFGSWQNNNSTDGTFVYTGFKPVMILLKNTDNTENWYIIDSKRPGYNVSAGSVLGLCPNLTGSEPAGFTSTATIDILSNGFKIRSTNPANGEISFGTRNYVYAAFAETPARLSTAR